MKLEDKRKVIEVLMFTSCRMAPTMDEMIDDDMDNGEVWFDRKTIILAQIISDEVLRELPDRPEPEFDLLSYDEAAITAAYLLIESSPTLRREWFGAR